jgi:6-phosphogluconolactonase (cycloisomerase 2 family)
MFCKIVLPAETLYISDYNKPMVIDGEVYTGLGEFLDITDTTSELRVSKGELTVTISGIANDYLATFLTTKIKGARIYVYRGIFDAGTGELIEFSGAPYKAGSLTSIATDATGTGPSAIAVSGNGKFLYVSNATAYTLSIYSIDANTGELTLQSTASYTSTTYPQKMTVSSDGGFLFTASISKATSYSINQTTGALSTVTSASLSIIPIGIAITTDNLHLYISDSSSNKIYYYSVNATTKALTYIGSITSTSARGIAVDPLNKFLYLASYSSNLVRSFSINQTTGVLTAGATYNVGTGPVAVATDRTGQFLYVVNSTGSSVSVFTRNTDTGVLTVGTSIATATSGAPTNLTIDASNRYLYVSCPNANAISTYTINQTTGALTLLEHKAVTGAPTSVKANPYFPYIYATKNTANLVEQFSINTAYQSPFYNLVGKFQGIVNNFTINESWSGQSSTNTISMICKSSVGMLQMKIAGRRTNPIDEALYYPGDTSMDRVPAITNTQINFGAPPIA